MSDLGTQMHAAITALQQDMTDLKAAVGDLGTRLQDLLTQAANAVQAGDLQAAEDLHAQMGDEIEALQGMAQQPSTVTPPPPPPPTNP